LQDLRTSEKRMVEKIGSVGARILRYQKSIIVLLAFAGILSSVFLCGALRRGELANIRAGFETVARERISVFRDHVEQHLQNLDSLAGFFTSSHKVERSEFRRFTRQFLQNNHEICSLQWVPLVRDQERDAYEALSRKEGFADYQISAKLGWEQTVRAPRRPEYFPVHFVEPYEGNEARLGFDLACDPAMLETLQWSRENKTSAATAPLISPQETEDAQVVLIVRPVYDGPDSMGSPCGSRENLKGFVLGELRTDRLLDGVLAHFEPFGMDICLVDRYAPKGWLTAGLHASRTRDDAYGTSIALHTPEELPEIFGLHVTGELQVANRIWTILCVPTPAVFARGRTIVPWIALGSGLGFTAMLSLLGMVVLQRIARSRRFTARLLESRDELRREIDEHKRTERALLETQKRFNLAIEGANEGIWDWPDLESDEQWWSPRWYELLGYENCEIEASYSNFRALISPEDLEKTEAAVREHFERREPVNVELRLRTKSGQYRWFRSRGQAVWDQSGRPRRMSGSIHDITEQKVAEQRILREKRFSENLIDSSLDGICAYDDKCLCTIWNPGMERIAGVGREQALGKCVFDVFPFLRKAEESRFFYEALAGRTVVARDRPYIVPETEKQGFFEGHYSPLRDASGDIIGGLAIIRDITARKQAEEELGNSKSLYQNLVETSHDLIFQCDNKGEFVFLNKAWESTTGYRIEEMLGKPFSRFKKPDLAARDSEAFGRLLEGESISGYETTYVTKSGEERYLLLDVVPRYDVSGRVIGVQGTAFDFTERKLAERALEDLNRELETTVERLIVANRELADFAHITAHDLRTPLRGVGSLAGIVAAEYADKLDQHGRELLDMLVGRASRMYGQIGSILEYSEIGRIEEKERRVNLKKLIEAITAALAPPENVEISAADSLPILMCNETRLAQVFRNLLDNAIKQMDKPEGRIRIDCAEEADFWKFSVADNGRGIEEKYFKKIFQIFQTLVKRDEVEATGIGLSIVKKIIETSGGTIWVESELGEGTTFFFTLPKQKMGANQ